jgi:hypothetical protein
MRQSDLPNFDPVFCGKVIKYAAVACTAVYVLEILILLTIDSTGSRCPGWYLPVESPTSLWLTIILITGPGVIAIVYNARHWDRVAHRITHGEPEPTIGFPETPYDKIKKRYETDEFRKQFQYNRTLLVVSIGWVFFCAAPLFLMAGYCVNWPRP